MNEAASSAFSRLHPSLRYVISTNLGWRSLRPMQEDAIPAILSGATTLVVAPTAGGKTEAAVLPLFSNILDHGWTPTSVLYLAPLRALLNDLGDRLGELAGYLGLSVGVWHGDVGQRERRRLASVPPDVLLTTPESLEVMLSMASAERRALLVGLRAVVVDEVHAFYGVDRGTQLLALLERLQAWTGHDIQRIGLSATIGNPTELVKWIHGSRSGETALIRGARSTERVEVFEVAYHETLPGIVGEISRFAGEKLIAFCRTRSDVEELAHALDAAGRPAWAHHSALSRENREDSERSFSDANEGVLVATSTLELGIDIGDLDRVVQVDAPTTVASLLQRLGRTGRRGGDARMTFIATNAEQLTLIAALLALHGTNWIEPIVPPWRPFPVLVQQILAIVLQGAGVGRSTLVGQLTRNAAFARITPSEIDEVIEHLLAETILETADGALTMGEVAERRFGYRNFSDLVSVFRGTDSVAVQTADRDVGTLDRWFIEDMLARNRSTFLLNGRAWNVVRWPEADSILEVVPASSADAPMFLGTGVVLSWELMQSVRGILADARPFDCLLTVTTTITKDATAVLNEIRRLAAPQRLELPKNPLVREGPIWQLYTYAGLRANRLLADCLFGPLGVEATATNTSLKLRGGQLNVETIQKPLAAFGVESIAQWLDSHEAPTRAETKFAELLPARARENFNYERSYDVAGALKSASCGVRTAVREANA